MLVLQALSAFAASITSTEDLLRFVALALAGIALMGLVVPLLKSAVLMAGARIPFEHALGRAALGHYLGFAVLRMADRFIAGALPNFMARLAASFLVVTLCEVMTYQSIDGVTPVPNREPVSSQRWTLLALFSNAVLSAGLYVLALVLFPC